MKTPDKNKQYVLNSDGNGTLWEIWDGEDFSDGNVLLYEVETNEDFTISLEKFHQYFTAVRNIDTVEIPFGVRAIQLGRPSSKEPQEQPPASFP